MGDVKLIEVSNDSPLRVAAKNIRIELAAQYPSIKFTVNSKRFSMGNSIRVGWTDGPTSKEVDTIINKYSAGTFDGMVDLYTYSHNAFIDKYGSGKYITSNRHYSDEFVAMAIEALKVEYNAVIFPSVDDFNMGKAWGTPLANTNRDHHWEWQSLIHRWCEETNCTNSKPRLAVVSTSNTGKATLAALEADQNADWTIGDGMVADGLKSRSDYTVIGVGQIALGLKPKSYNTLRQYNATASFWPKADRFQGVEWDAEGTPHKGDVTFGVHKIAMEGLGIKDAKKAITAVLASVNGNAHKVSVAKVKEAVAQIKLSEGIATGAVKATEAVKPKAVPETPPSVTGESDYEALLRIMRSMKVAELDEMSDPSFRRLDEALLAFSTRVELSKAKRAKTQARATAKPKQVGRQTPQPKKADKAKALPKKGRKNVRGSI